MKTFQAELWDGVIAALRGMCLYEKCETPRMLELEKLFEDMSEKFSNTLTASQQKAVRDLLDIFNDVGWERRDTGIATGLLAATELHRFLANPPEALRQASEGWNPVVVAEECNIQALNKYFNELKERV